MGAILDPVLVATLIHRAQAGPMSRRYRLAGWVLHAFLGSAHRLGATVLRQQKKIVVLVNESLMKYISVWEYCQSCQLSHVKRETPPISHGKCQYWTVLNGTPLYDDIGRSWQRHIDSAVFQYNPKDSVTINIVTTLHWLMVQIVNGAFVLTDYKSELTYVGHLEETWEDFYH